jgi:hypothetical protein
VDFADRLAPPFVGSETVFVEATHADVLAKIVWELMTRLPDFRAGKYSESPEALNIAGYAAEIAGPSSNFAMRPDVVEPAVAASVSVLVPAPDLIVVAKYPVAVDRGGVCGTNSRTTGGALNTGPQSLKGFSPGREMPMSFGSEAVRP